MESKIRDTTNNSICLNPNVERIINQYKENLDWMLYELSSISSVPSEYQYFSPIGKITIKTN